jgi:hypothetical protein
MLVELNDSDLFLLSNSETIFWHFCHASNSLQVTLLNICTISWQKFIA